MILICYQRSHGSKLTVLSEPLPGGGGGGGAGEVGEYMKGCGQERPLEFLAIFKVLKSS